MDAAARRRDRKIGALRGAHALNPRPETVADPVFTGDNPFFDRADLVQVKYEMVRRVRAEGQRVSRSAAAFGFSRPSYYATAARFEAGGLPGLLPQRPGPKRAHKLSDEVVDFLEGAIAEDRSLRSPDLAARVAERFNVGVHPRSIERALARRRQKGGAAST